MRFLLFIFVLLITFNCKAGVNNPSGGSSSGGGSSTNSQSFIPWMSITNDGTTAYFITNSTKITTANLDGPFAFTNFPNYFSQLQTIPTLNVTNINSMSILNFVTNISSSTATITLQGGHTLNIEAAAGSGAVTNAPNIFTSASQNTFKSWTEFVGAVTNDSSLTITNNYSSASRIFLDSGGTTRIDYQNLALTGAWSINGLSSSTLVTNLTSSGATVTITGQGTPVLNLESASASGAQTNAANNWLKVNTFTTNLFVYGAGVTQAAIIIGTNIDFDTGSMLTLRQNNGRTGITLFGTGNMTIFRGNTFGTSYAYDQYAGGSQNWQFENVGAGSSYFSFDNTARLTLTRTTTTIGQDSTHGVTMNASTMAIPNNLMIDSGGLWLPTSLTAISTNGWSTNQFNGDINVLRGATFSNVVVKTTTGTSSIDSGTNLTFNIISSSGAGTIKTKGIFGTATNTLTAALPLINTIYTNNDTRLYCNIGVLVPSLVAGGSATALWSASGTFTNYQGVVSSEPGLASSTTNNVTGFINPNALYMVTNLNTSGGTPTLIQGYWNENRF